MPRRKSYTEVKRNNFQRPAHVEGMGDRVFRGFQCLNRECTNFLFVRDDDVGPDFSITCEKCGYTHAAGESLKIYDYELIRDGAAIILHHLQCAEAARAVRPA